MSVWAAAARHRRRIRHAFEARRAVDFGSALTLAELGLEPDRWFRRLAREGVIREAGPRYWFDHEAAGEQRRSRLIRAAVALLIGLVVGWLGSQGFLGG